jgi:peptide deformylase
MILPIFTYGHAVLRQSCAELLPDYPDLDITIMNLWETMRNASGCGLAAPQVGLPLQLFIVDSATTYQQLGDEEKAVYYELGDTGIKEVFINAQILEYSDRVWTDDEGCLSLPGFSQPVSRSWSITICYYDQFFHQQHKTFFGATARMIQHEYDHTQGVLYTDRLSALRRRRLTSKLEKMSRGYVSAPYPIMKIKDRKTK